MTENKSVKHAARALAAEKGIKYTEARREVARTQEATATTAAFLADIFNAAPPTPAASLSDDEWTIHFASHEDLSMPYPLHVTNGGLIGAQYFWRGEKFQILGFTEEPKAGAMTLRWETAAEEARHGATSHAVGMYPVISDATGTWSTWATAVSEISHGHRPDRLDNAVTATFRAADPIADAGKPPHFEFRCEELLAALTDDELRQIEADDWVANAQVSGWLYRSAVCRGDENAVAASDWVDARYDADQDAFDEDEPFRIDFDDEEMARWMAEVRLYPSQR
jgi:hypothetical protein